MDAEEQKQSNAIRSRWLSGVEARKKARKKASESLVLGFAFMISIPAMTAIAMAYILWTPNPAISLVDVLPVQGLAFMFGAFFMLCSIGGE